MGKAADPEQTAGAQVERITEIAIQTAQQHINRLQPAKFFQQQLVATHGQVGSLDEGDIHFAGEVDMLVIARCKWPRRQQRNTRVAALRTGCHGLQPIGPGLEELVTAANLLVGEHLRHGARQRPAVGQRKTGTGRHLRPVRNDGPVTIRAAHEIGRINLQVTALRVVFGHIRCIAAQWSQIVRIAIDQIGRKQALAQGFLRPVEIGQQPVEHLCPLDDPSLDIAPFLTGEDQRHYVEQPFLVIPAAGMIAQ